MQRTISVAVVGALALSLAACQQKAPETPSAAVPAGDAAFAAKFQE